MQLINPRNVTDSIMNYGTLTKAAADQGAYYKSRLIRALIFLEIFSTSPLYMRVDTDYSIHAIPGYDTEYFLPVNNDAGTRQKFASYLHT